MTWMERKLECSAYMMVRIADIKSDVNPFDFHSLSTP